MLILQLYNKCMKEYMTMLRTHHFEGHPTGTQQVGEEIYDYTKDMSS
jgi:hypothetical protein